MILLDHRAVFDAILDWAQDSRDRTVALARRTLPHGCAHVVRLVIHRAYLAVDVVVPAACHARFSDCRRLEEVLELLLARQFFARVFIIKTRAASATILAQLLARLLARLA